MPSCRDLPYLGIKIPTLGSNQGLLCLLHWQVGSLRLAPTVQVDTATTYNVVNALKAWRGKPEILLVGVREDCQKTKDGVSSWKIKECLGRAILILTLHVLGRFCMCCSFIYLRERNVPRYRLPEGLSVLRKEWSVYWVFVTDEWPADRIGE